MGKQYGVFDSIYELLYGKQESNTHGRGNSHKLGQQVTNELVNSDGSMWVGTIYMGGDIPMDVVYDTGSDWLVVEGYECSNCEGNVYDPTDSQVNPIKLVQVESERSYGSAQLTGYEYLDRVCINLSTCIDTFEYFLMTSQIGINEPIDGILGMARNEPFILNPDAGNISGPLLIEALAEEGVINANKFSFYFQHPSEASWVDVGEPNLDHFKEGSKVVTTQMQENDFFWSVMSTGVAIGQVENAFAYENVESFPGF